MKVVSHKYVDSFDVDGRSIGNVYAFSFDDGSALDVVVLFDGELGDDVDEHVAEAVKQYAYNEGLHCWSRESASYYFIYDDGSIVWGPSHTSQSGYVARIDNLAYCGDDEELKNMIKSYMREHELDYLSNADEICDALALTNISCEAFHFEV
jgi:hypothetical protein